MGGFHLVPEAEAELDDIWLYIARESGSIEIANRVIDTITERFWLLGQHQQIGRAARSRLAPRRAQLFYRRIRDHLPDRG